MRQHLVIFRGKYRHYIMEKDKCNTDHSIHTLPHKRHTKWHTTCICILQAIHNKSIFCISATVFNAVSFIVKVNMRSDFILSNLPMTPVPEGVLWTCLFQKFWLLIMLWSLYWKSKMTAKYVRQKWKYLLLHCKSIYEHFILCLKCVNVVIYIQETSQ